MLVAVVALGAPALVPPAPAAAVSYDVASHALKFQQAKRSAVSPSGATGRNVGDVMKYAGVATIEGTVIDAVVTTVAFSGLTVQKFDEGSAVTAPPPGSSQSVDDLFMTDVDAPASAPGQLTYSFAFYEGGTYTGAGTGVPVTLANAVINTYDIDGNGGAKQYVDFSGFQTYTVYSQSETRGIDLANQGGGLVRFITRDGSFNATTTTGSYSFTRVQVNYDRISTLTVRLGLSTKSPAYFALDFSAGGIWTTDGVNPVSPQPQPNPFNTPPETADIETFFAALGTGYVFRSADFPYSDLDDNVFAAVTVATLPAEGDGRLEYFDGVAWVPATAGQKITTTDLDLGRLRLTPEASGGAFGFTVNDGLADSDPATLTFTAATSAQELTFPVPEAQNGTASRVVDSGATASSGLTPTLTSETPGVCTVSGLQITTLVLPAGVTTATCVVTATQDGNAEYGRAQAVTVRFPVTRLTPQTITFPAPADRAVTSPSFSADATTTAAGLSVALTSLTPEVCTVSAGNISPVAPGLCSVRASQAGDSTYAPASPVTRTFTLAKAAQTITFAAPPTRAVDVGTVTVAPTTDASGLTVTLASSTTSVCTVSGTTVTILATGTCTLTASQSGDATRLAAADVTRSFRVFGITTDSLAAGKVDRAYSAELAVVGAAGGGTWTSTALPAGLSLGSSTGVISGTPTQAWSDTVTVTYTEDGARHSVDLGLTITVLEPQTLAFAAPPAVSRGAGSAALAPTTDAVGLTPVLTSDTPSVCTVSGFVVTFLGAGTCTLTARQSGDGTRAAATAVSRSFPVIELPTQALPEAKVGEPYTRKLEVAGSSGGGVWAVVGRLPAGLVLDPATGVLSGTPTESFGQLVTFSYTEGGVVETVVIDLQVELPTASLGVTGADAAPVAGLAAMLLLAGAALLALRPRRRAAHRA